ncbi:CehA/McbA family metallohydrolase [Haliangium sp.]|uniref:CehA/McbA family metallohydrolase n=1 Tax=Haliangium sp. TaxID=2663208 RepID=UPI003D107BCF
MLSRSECPSRPRAAGSSTLAVAAAAAVVALAAAGCGGGSGDPPCDPQAPDTECPPPPPPSLDDFLPAPPAPTGEPQSVWAGPITDAGELVDGPAAASMVGDYYLRNSRARFVIQAPSRVIGVVPQGGNLIDAVPLGPDGAPIRGDQFGELSMVYVLGRTCEHTQIEVVQDGSGGGAAVLRARGRSAPNDFINLRGVGLFEVPPELDPDSDDGVLCATTYVLAPDADHLEVSWTLVNPGDVDIRGPFGSLSDTGGDVHVFSPTRGFEKVGIETLAGGDARAPVEYVVHQAPDLAYGLLPRHAQAGTTSASFTVSGVSILLFGGEGIFDLLAEESFYLDLPARGGVTHGLDVRVALDAAEVERDLQRGVDVAGTVRWSDDAIATEARIGLYRDVDGGGTLDADDVIVTYAHPDAEGAFSASLPAGNYLAVAAVPDLGVSAPLAFSTEGAPALDLVVPAPVTFDYSIQDGDGNPMSARLSVVGRHPAPRDRRLFETFDQASGTVRVVHAVRGTTTDLGDGADPALRLPVSAAGPVSYRILASHGAEWSVDEVEITVAAGDTPAPLAFTLEHVAPTPGYISSEYHVHQLGSPDSTVTNELRVASMVAEGLELFATSDHDYVSDLQPVIEVMGVDHLVRNIPGIEVTPFVYGHFNAWPILPDETSPNQGAIDWARGSGGYAMIPGEIFGAMRARGADIVQVNHPRSALPGSRSFQQFFDRAGLSYDYDDRQVITELGPVPNSWLRLPEVSLWSDDFDAIEVWNGMSPEDTDGDGIREITELDLVMRDWFNFLSLGLITTPIGNSDTHRAFADPPGVPRTYVRVSDDSALALMSGDVVFDVLDALSGRVARDVVVTNGPFLEVSVAGREGSVIGAELAAADVGSGPGEVTFTVRATAPTWAAFDTIEVFANATPETPLPGRRLEVSALQPHLCYTTRPAGELAANDPCALAVGGARPMAVDTVTVGTSARLEASLDIPVDAAAIATRDGATGTDAWLVFRVRGQRAVYPILLEGVTAGDTVDTLVEGDPATVEALLAERGVPAAAFTAPILVDFDGGGYRASFSPE